MNFRSKILNLPDRESNILTEQRGFRFYITFNRPKRRNSFSLDMYDKLTALFEYAISCPSIHYIILSGANNYFSSGNDLSNFTDPQIQAVALACYPNQSAESMNAAMITMVSKQLSALARVIVDCSKPIFALVEGAAIGFAFTQLLLYDRVFATADCVFFAPLITTAQGPEMCASYTFPRVFGKTAAHDLICFGKKVDAAFLQKYGVVEVGNGRKEIQTMLDKHIEKIEQLEWESYFAARGLMRQEERQEMRKCNEREIENLVVRWGNPKLMEYLMKQLKNKEPKL